MTGTCRGVAEPSTKQKTLGKKKKNRPRKRWKNEL